MRIWLVLLHFKNLCLTCSCYTVKSKTLIGAATLSKISFCCCCYAGKNETLIGAATLSKMSRWLMKLWLELLHCQNCGFGRSCYTVKNEALIGASTLLKNKTLIRAATHSQKWEFDWSCYTVKNESLIRAPTLSKLCRWSELLHCQNCGIN